MNNYPWLVKNTNRKKTRTPKACRQQGCKNSTVLKHGYCEDHKPIRWSKESASSRGYGYQWQKLRQQALKRDLYLCVHCKKKGIIEPATEVDHILSKAKGGKDCINNVQCLCTPCHRLKTQTEKFSK